MCIKRYRKENEKENSWKRAMRSVRPEIIANENSLDSQMSRLYQLIYGLFSSPLPRTTVTEYICSPLNEKFKFVSLLQFSFNFISIQCIYNWEGFYDATDDFVYIFENYHFRVLLQVKWLLKFRKFYQISKYMA